MKIFFLMMSDSSFFITLEDVRHPQIAIICVIHNKKTAKILNRSKFWLSNTYEINVNYAIKKKKKDYIFQNIYYLCGDNGKGGVFHADFLPKNLAMQRCQQFQRSKAKFIAAKPPLRNA